MKLKFIQKPQQVSWKSRQSLHVWSLLERGWRKYGDVNFEPQCLIRDALGRCGDQLTRVSFADCPPFRLSRYTIEMIGQHCPNLEALDLGGRVLAESAIHVQRIFSGYQKLMNFRIVYILMLFRGY